VAVFKQRREGVPVRVYTTEYRIYGTVHLVPGRSTSELFNLEQHSFVPMTDVQLFSPGFGHPPEQREYRGRVPFLALNRGNVLWVVGGRPHQPSTGATREVRVSLLFKGVLIAGTVQVPTGQRISDLLYTSREFATLTAASLYPLGADVPFSELKARATYDFVTVNLAMVSAVVEG
jgi:hypothetical protein